MIYRWIINAKMNSYSKLQCNMSVLCLYWKFICAVVFWVILPTDTPEVGYGLNPTSANCVMLDNLHDKTESPFLPM